MNDDACMYALHVELHPDKNKAPDAADKFRKVKAAFDVLSDKGKRKEYNRLGDRGVAVHAQSVIDHKYILLQLVVYYCSSIVFAFLMTFSEPTGDAFSISLFGLTGNSHTSDALDSNEYDYEMHCIYGLSDAPYGDGAHPGGGASTPLVPTLQHPLRDNGLHASYLPCLHEWLSVYHRYAPVQWSDGIEHSCRIYMLYLLIIYDGCTRLILRGYQGPPSVGPQHGVQQHAGRVREDK